MTILAAFVFMLFLKGIILISLWACSYDMGRLADRLGQSVPKSLVCHWSLMAR